MIDVGKIRKYMFEYVKSVDSCIFVYFVWFVMPGYAFSYCDIVSIIELCVCTDVDQLSLRVYTINWYHTFVIVIVILSVSWIMRMYWHKSIIVASVYEKFISCFYDCCCDFVCINELCVCTRMNQLSCMYARGWCPAFMILLLWYLWCC